MSPNPLPMKTVKPFNGPLFIVGMPRSGTKLLRSILNQHPRISIPDIETEFLPYWVRHWTTFGDLSNREIFGRFFARCQALPFFVYAGETGKPVNVDRWYAACTNFGTAGVFEALICSYLGIQQGHGRIWGDKSPSYVTHLHTLTELYPTARFIHIVRDARDHCLSVHRAWGKSMLRAAQRWSDDVTSARSAGQLLGDRYFELRYEDLIADPRITIMQICTFLGTEYSPQMLVLPEPTENLGNTKGVRGIVADNAGKYGQELDAATRERIESIAGDTLRETGYDCAVTKEPLRLSSGRMRWLQFIDGLQLLRFSAKDRGVLGSIRFVLRYFWVSGNR